MQAMLMSLRRNPRRNEGTNVWLRMTMTITGHTHPRPAERRRSTHPPNFFASSSSSLFPWLGENQERRKP